MLNNVSLKDLFEEIKYDLLIKDTTPVVVLKEGDNFIKK